LGIFVLVLAFAVWQWRDLGQARDARDARATNVAQSSAAPALEAK